RDLVEIVVMFFEVLVQVVERFDVGVHALFLRIGYEDDAIDTAQDELAAGVVEDLSGDGVEVETGLEATDGAEVERQEVEEQSTDRLGGERDHLALLLVTGLVEDHLQVRRLAAESGAVIDDLAVDLAGREIDKTQTLPLSS